MLDKFLSFASVFDCITPTVAYVEDFLNGPISDFGISANAGWGTGDIKRLLKEHGIHSWGLMFNLSGETLMFTVSQAQAKWTYDLLQQKGIPILYAPADVVNSTPSPSQTTKGENSLDSFLNWLDTDF